MSKLLSTIRSRKINIIKLLVVAGVALLVVSAFSWWRIVYISPSHVFNRMLAGSLATSSVSKTTSQADDTQQLIQTTMLMTSPVQQAHASGVLRQAADSGTQVTTESIGTPTVDYVRYTDIRTSDKMPNGKPFDFTNVLGVWGKSDTSGGQAGGATQLYNQTLLGVFPVANVPQPLRKQLMQQIKKTNVYAIDKGTVKRNVANGRLIYTYDATVRPVAYVTMLKEFARSLGLKQLEKVDPSQYANSAPLRFTVDIDVWSSHLTGVTYKDSQRTEVLGAYGARLPAALPNSSIPVNELQSRLQKTQ